MNIIYLGDIPDSFKEPLEDYFSSHRIPFLQPNHIQDVEHPPTYTEKDEHDLYTPHSVIDKLPTHPSDARLILRVGYGYNVKQYHNIALWQNTRKITMNTDQYLLVTDRTICLRLDQKKAIATINDEGRRIVDEWIDTDYFTIYADHWRTYGVVASIANLTPEEFLKVVIHEWYHIFIHEGTNPAHYNDQAHCPVISCYMHELNDIGDIQNVNHLCSTCKSYIPFYNTQ